MLYVLVLDLEGQVLGLGLAICVLDSVTGYGALEIVCAITKLLI